MDKSEAQRIVQANIKRIRNAMSLHDWYITIEYGPCSNPNWGASCDRSGGDYKRANIIINPELHDTEEEVLSSLTHELIHIALAPFDVYRDILTSLVPAMHELGSPTAVAEQRAWTHALETTVTLLERGIARHLWEAEEAPEANPDEAEPGLTD